MNNKNEYLCLKDDFAIFLSNSIFFAEMSVPSGVKNNGIPKPVEPLEWLIGTWRCEDSAQGSFPTINDFKYGEELTFSNVGQPMLNMSSFTWHPEKKVPMHQETGFLRIKPGTNQVCLVLSHNFGITTVEEGTLDGHSISFESTNIGRMSFAKEPEVKKLCRGLKLDGEILTQTIFMETSKTPLTKHLEVTYVKKD